MDAPALLRLEVAYDPTVNFAMQQNAVPLVKRVALHNAGTETLRDLELRLRCEPEVAPPRTFRLAEVGPGERRPLPEADLALDGERLVRQTEREAGQLILEVVRDGEVLHAERHPLEVLAYDEWNGSPSLPEILAAFVLPNHPAVEELLAAAAVHLEAATGDPALSGYQRRDPRRVAATVAAIYAAVRDRKLTYVAPPASFERRGQKIRTPDRILETGLATCLDLATLFAACFEQAGLHPLLVLEEGHAYVGAWLEEECFPDPALDDAVKLRKRVELETIVVLEATAVVGRPLVEFDRAVADARRRLEADERFVFLLDVKSARDAQIRPLPVRHAAGAYETPPAPAPREMEPPPAAATAGEPATPAGPRTRIDRWQRKLLDLSLRNRLINYRETRRKTIPIVTHDLAELEDALADGRTFTILPQAGLLAGDGPRELDAAARADFLRARLAEGRLHAPLDDEDLDRRLLEIFRAARLGQQESDANTLYLALGFLRWYETPASDQERRAPLLLLPLALDRQSVRSGFTLRLDDDEARINVTLLRKLEADFGLEIPGLETLPQDASGLDVNGIFRRLREAILPFDRWEIVEEAHVGLFSFTKYLMWLDLAERSQVLKRNAVVRHLVDRASEEFVSELAFPEAARLDQERDPAETFCPLDADSSQLRAVHAAADGKTFVLQGPPGTGKSQTIANVISHGLATGRRVLFVSEKIAALDVVHRRLERIGLGPFCLPLHSNKARKSEVFERLRDALDVAATRAPAEWTAEAARMREVRDGLNAYCEALRRPRETGESAFDGLARLVGLRDEPDVGLDLPEADAAALQRWRDCADRLAAEAAEVGAVAGHALLPVHLEEWGPGLPARVTEAATALAANAATLEEAVAGPAGRMGLAACDTTTAELERLEEWCALMETSPRPPPESLAPGWNERRTALAGWIERGRARDAARDKLLARYREAIFDLHLPDLRARLERARTSFVLWRWLIARPARKALAAVANGALADDAQLVADVGEAARLRKESQGIEAAGVPFGRFWNDWDRLEALVAWCDRFHALLPVDPDERSRLRQRWSELAAEGAELFEGDAGFAAFRAARAACDEGRLRLDGMLALDEEAAWPEGRLDAAASFGEQAHGLRVWCRYRRSSHAADEAGLTPLVAALETGRIDAATLPVAFERSFYGWWVGRLLVQDPVLRDFSSGQQNRAIERFRELDARLLDLARAEIRARLAAEVPRGEADAARSASSEMGILQREIRKKRRQMPLRRLFDAIPNVLARVKPCLLMSPLSVAQYLSPEFPPFDLVVFDEASQIPVWDAVGAIARGEKLLVVGDSRQLPPTTFFAREEDDENFDEDAFEDLESILDECVAARLPQLRLEWHYRSRHEGLIAFSNYHYYDNRLQTFPSAHGPDAPLGVSLRALEGTYDKGGTRTNRAEAEAVTAEIVRRLADEERSLGVVTFSIAQQGLIEDLLEQARRDHPAIDRHFTDAVDEPVFVKNLENVQGDERDVILFSVCYGPDERGRVSMNFGPLNREGGERRLNVAITRAREQVVVFSTLRADRIDLSRTRATGVAHLKSFLEYAEQGPGSIAGATVERDGPSALEEAVRRALEARGLEVEKQVGCSGYRIDLAVRKEGRYRLGIECDGPHYHRAHTARDRDRIRDAVLRNLGWRLHRVWSPDWWYDPEREVEKILAALAAEPEPEAAPPEAVFEPAPAEPEARPPSYRALEAETQGDADAFHASEHAASVRSWIERAIEAEAPIALDLLARRVAGLWGIQRVTQRVLRRVEELLPAPPRAGIVWRADQDPALWSEYRVPGDERETDDLPVEEIANGAAAVLDLHVRIGREDLARETARLFGIHRLGTRVQRAMELGIDHLLARGGARADGDAVSLP